MHIHFYMTLAWIIFLVFLISSNIRLEWRIKLNKQNWCIVVLHIIDSRYFNKVSVIMKLLLLLWHTHIEQHATDIAINFAFSSHPVCDLSIKWHYWNVYSCGWNIRYASCKLDNKLELFSGFYPRTYCRASSFNYTVSGISQYFHMRNKIYCRPRTVYH